jgi:hypothetical protein
MFFVGHILRSPDPWRGGARSSNTRLLREPQAQPDNLRSITSFGSATLFARARFTSRPAPSIGVALLDNLDERRTHVACSSSLRHQRRSCLPAASPLTTGHLSPGTPATERPELGEPRRFVRSYGPDPVGPRRSFRSPASLGTTRRTGTVRDCLAAREGVLRVLRFRKESALFRAVLLGALSRSEAFESRGRPIPAPSMTSAAALFPRLVSVFLHPVTSLHGRYP